MKHQTPSLAKFKKLKRRLNLGKTRDVIGLLESLWHLTQSSAPRGDIGADLDDEDIAIELEWDDDPNLLIDALVETRWLDRCPKHRLVVHDWAEHAPRYVHGIAAKKGGIVTAEPPQQTGSQLDVTTTTTVDDYSPARNGLQSGTTVDDCTEEQPNLTKPNLTKQPPLASARGGGARARFKIPTFEDVRDYCRERANEIDVEQFIDHYEARGWELSKGRKMKDWKACVRTWEKNNFNRNGNQTQRSIPL